MTLDSSKAGNPQDSYTKMVAEVYDKIYSQRAYDSEAAKIKRVIARYKQSDGNQLLDIACGTGNFWPYLADFEITGLDQSSGQLAQADKKFPGHQLHQASMVDFQLPDCYDVVTCSFRSIGYMSQLDQLQQALANMAGHLKPGGVLVFDPWLFRDQYQPGTIHAQFVDESELKISRISHSSLESGKSVMNMHHLVGKPDGVDYFVERHEMGLYSPEEYRQAIEAAGLEAVQDQYDDGWPLFIGVSRPEGR